MFGEEKLSTYLNRSKLLSNVDCENKIRVAILGSFTLNGLEETIRVKCGDKKIQCSTYIAGYNQYIELPVFLIAAIAVGIISGAYSTEVLRGAFLAVPKGQIEASKSVGMNKFLIFRRILVPQVMRYALPGLGNVWQLTLKDTALIMVTGVVEIMRQAHVAAGSTYSPFTFYITAALLYLVLTSVSSRVLNSAESWANKGVRRA